MGRQIEMFARTKRGRPKKARSSEAHRRRPELKARHPVHVTCRMVRDVASLRRRRVYQAIRWATLKAAQRENFRIVHMSIQRTHLHLIVEADDKWALARGMQGFAISAARLINGAIERRGAVFADRYHPHVLRSPGEVRRAIAYVLNNWRKHREEASWPIDPFASGAFFEGWKERERESRFRPREGYDPLIVWRPRTWLLRTGWVRGGGLISMREVPGQRSEAERARPRPGP